VDSEESAAFSSDGAPSRSGFATDGFHQVKEGLRDLKGQFAYLLSAKIDRFKLSIRKAVILGVVAMVGMCAAAGLAATLGAVLMLFLLRGAAGGLSALFGGTPWLGELVLSVVIFGAVGTVLGVSLVRVQRASRKKLIEKYEALGRRAGLSPRGTTTGTLHE